MSFIDPADTIDFFGASAADAKKKALAAEGMTRSVCAALKAAAHFFTALSGMAFPHDLQICCVRTTVAAEQDSSK